MSDMEKSSVERNAEEESKVISLFEFIRELNKLKNRPVLNISEHPWNLMFSNIPDDPENIKICYRDRVDDEDESESGDQSGAESVLMSVRKPELAECPEPDKSFSDCLLPGWENYANDVLVSEHSETDGTPSLFNDDENIVMLYQNWIEQREKWRERRKIQEETKKLFDKLFSLNFELIRDAETEEIIVANGILCDSGGTVEHPVLTHRVKIDFDPDENTIFIRDTNAQSELYNAMLQQTEGVIWEAVGNLNEELKKEDYHPLDRNEKGTPYFLKNLIHRLSPTSLFSEKGKPENWQKTNNLLLYSDPCFIVRKRLNGTVETINEIIENIEETGRIPTPIRQLVSGGVAEMEVNTEPESVEEQLAAVGGESSGIALSKEANKEQLEIAKRIDCNDAVLVQGPPGTGKTHTIANLMGHFFSQGKSVLVTSYTNKALSVLKDKIDPALQSLCVSVIDESNADMEKSVEGITNYMSNTTSFALKQEMNSLKLQRDEIIGKLADVRRKIFEVVKQECTPVVYNKEEISPSAAAKFVAENIETLSYIPGKILSDDIPLLPNQFDELYRSNESVSKDEEKELAGLPDPATLLSPFDFSSALKKIESAKDLCGENQEFNGWEIVNNPDDGCFSLAGKEIRYPKEEDLDALKECCSSFAELGDWMKAAVVAGKNSGQSRENWKELVSAIEQCCKLADSEQLGADIRFSADDITPQHIKNIRDLKDKFLSGGKIGRLARWLKIYAPALEIVTVDGHELQTAKECQCVLDKIELKKWRRKCASFWNELLLKYDENIPDFMSLDKYNPERVAKNFIPKIEKCLDWYQKDYKLLAEKIGAVGFPSGLIFAFGDLDSDIVKVEKIINAAGNIIPQLCNICRNILKLQKSQSEFEVLCESFETLKKETGDVCSNLMKAVSERDPDAYGKAFARLKEVYEKSDILKKRTEMLEKLKEAAPEWAAAIAAREGIHGLPTVPDNVEGAWKWKRLECIIADMISRSFEDLQDEAAGLSREYRRKTAEYAEKSAWYHLLDRTETDITMKQALQGWKQTVKRIGKGTGKRAPRYKAKARELMSKCQTAVPGWIMPINKALETLNPRENKFDVVIIDEASQADISSLAILYMGEKLIIVGDDKQVTPMAVGIEIGKIEYLERRYIKDRIPNSHLYNEKASIYDIAATTFRPLMLQEHFRCVPDIIGFSNMLSYDGRIKPLRESGSSRLFPAVINYRVKDGARTDGKTKINTKEAEAVVALMQACIKQPEYAGKTFGVISLLGDDQVKKIQSCIEKNIDPREIQSRRILCGNSANFQGDERDVIFLSLVDSGKGTGQIRKQSEGEDNSAKKRYNVAASRAKDQLWIVNSLDAASDLKPGDLRKVLLDWSLNPRAFGGNKGESEKYGQTPFESAVAGCLSDRGFHIVRHWEAGSYILNTVVLSGENKVAVECDGERYDSSESKIRENMERQTILERLGWKFIRVRGSKYYRFPEETVCWIVDELKKYGIRPEGNLQPETSETEPGLFLRVQQQASEILEEQDNASALSTVTGTQQGVSSDAAETLENVSENNGTRVSDQL